MFQIGSWPMTHPPARPNLHARTRPRPLGRMDAHKQIAFVEALSETACVEDACRIVGMSPVSAYALRRRPPAHHFREAWDAALDMGVHRLEQAALGRALNGVARPVFYKGEQVGEWREYDERLTMFLLRYRLRGATARCSTIRRRSTTRPPPTRKPHRTTRRPASTGTATRWPGPKAWTGTDDPPPMPAQATPTASLLAREWPELPKLRAPGYLPGRSNA